jgi:hypothetical protein
MNSHRRAVAAALDALRIESPTGFSWYGEPSTPLSAEVIEEMGAEAARTYLCHGLQGQLYSSFYCAGQAIPQPRQRLAMQPRGASPFIDSLSRANSGTGSRASGWEIARAEEDGRLVVHRDGLSLWTRPGEIIGADLSPGSEVSVTLPPELLRLSPGFYMALGDEELHVTEPIVRHYWHLSSSGGTALVAAATRAFNGERLPFRLKVLSDPAGYTRCDAGVLYTPQRLRRQVSGLLPSLLVDLAGHLRPGTPALAKPLAEGLAVAEGPPNAESFGMHRCGLLADAAVRAFELGLHELSERLALVEQHLGEQGIALDRPHLNPGSTGDYELVS